MNLQVILWFQIVADIALCIVIILFLWIITRDIKKKPYGVDENSLSEFRKLVDESRQSADHLFNALDEGRKSLKKIAFALDEKERKLKVLIEESDNRLEKTNFKKLEPETEESLQGVKKYEQVVKMAGKGFANSDIAHALGLAEGEISLIIELDRKKNEII